MDNTVKIFVGGVYQTILTDGPVRVIGLDDDDVFYDPYLPSLKRWALSSKPASNCAYYRTTPNVFMKKANFLRMQPLTPAELHAFRPDLPMKLCRYTNLSWSDQPIPDFAIYQDQVRQIIGDISDVVVLPVPKITLRPFGRKGTITALKSAIVFSEQPEGFSMLELLWLAHNIQAPHLKQYRPNGVGIFRSGHEKKVPSYYIGGFLSAGEEDD
jgi:hypothetical protein